MTSLPRPPIAAVALAVLLVSASVGSAAAADSLGEPTADASVDPMADASVPSASGSPIDPSGDRVGPLTECFAGEGHPIAIGETGAAMETVLHLSVLTDPAVGNEFGIEAAGTLDDEPIVTLAAGVRLTAREAIADGVDPFAAFDVLYTYELRLPMFDGSVGDAGYEDDGSPIDSGAGAVTC